MKPGPNASKYAIWMPPEVAATLADLHAQTLVSRSLLIRYLIMAYAAGEIRPDGLPEVKPSADAKTYLKHLHETEHK